jgi:hypothetical protein
VCVVGAHGNSYLGAVDVKHAVLSRLPQELLGSVPEQCVEQLMVSVGHMHDTCKRPLVPARPVWFVALLVIYNVHIR